MSYYKTIGPSLKKADRQVLAEHFRNHGKKLSESSYALECPNLRCLWPTWKYDIYKNTFRCRCTNNKWLSLEQFSQKLIKENDGFIEALNELKVTLPRTGTLATRLPDMSFLKIVEEYYLHRLGSSDLTLSTPCTNPLCGSGTSEANILTEKFRCDCTNGNWVTKKIFTLIIQGSLKFANHISQGGLQND